MRRLISRELLRLRRAAWSTSGLLRTELFPEYIRIEA